MKAEEQIKRWVESGFSKSETPNSGIILELIEQARLGRAVQKALRYGWMVHAVDVKDPDDCDTEVTEEAFDTVEELLEWAEQEVTK